jgi:hypothetical protein
MTRIPVFCDMRREAMFTTALGTRNTLKPRTLRKDALCLLGIGELQRLEQESLGLKRGDHNYQDNNDAAWILIFQS